MGGTPYTEEERSAAEAKKIEQRREEEEALKELTIEQVGTVTGRLSSDKPNMGQPPKTKSGHIPGTEPHIGQPPKEDSTEKTDPELKNDPSAV